MSDGAGVDEWLPGSVLPGVDAVVLYVLPFVQPLHGDGAVEGDGLVEVDFEGGVAGWGGPEGGGVAVGCRCRSRGSGYVAGLCDEVVLVEAMNCCSELLEALHIGVGYAACVVRRQAEHELGATAYRLGVDVEQLIDGVQGAFVVGVPEPVEFAQGGVGLYRAPA